MALIAASRCIGRFSFNSAQFASLDMSDVIARGFGDIWRVIVAQPHFPAKGKGGFPSEALVIGACSQAALDFGIANPEVVAKKSKVSYSGSKPEPALTDDFIDQVDRLLPPQPWPQHVHRRVAESLGCKRITALKAIEALIGSGRRNRQRGGVVYDAADNVLAIDENRARTDGS